MNATIPEKRSRAEEFLSSAGCPCSEGFHSERCLMKRRWICPTVVLAIVLVVLLTLSVIIALALGRESNPGGSVTPFTDSARLLGCCLNILSGIAVIGIAVVLTAAFLRFRRRNSP